MIDRAANAWFENCWHWYCQGCNPKAAGVWEPHDSTEKIGSIILRLHEVLLGTRKLGKPDEPVLPTSNRKYIVDFLNIKMKLSYIAFKRNLWPLNVVYGLCFCTLLHKSYDYSVFVGLH